MYHSDMILQVADSEWQPDQPALNEVAEDGDGDHADDTEQSSDAEQAALTAKPAQVSIHVVKVLIDARSLAWQVCWVLAVLKTVSECVTPHL